MNETKKTEVQCSAEGRAGDIAVHWKGQCRGEGAALTSL